MSSKELILLIDDDRDLTRLVSSFLSANGYKVDVSNTGDGAADLILQKNPSLVLLDLMLPGEDGISICRKVQDQYAGPIIMLTALGDDIDQVAGLEVGADDYLSKPVQPRVLLAHIRAKLRRFKRGDTNNTEAGTKNVLVLGEIELNTGSREVYIHRQLLELTTAEFDLLHYMMQYAGQVLSRDRLYLNLYSCHHDGVDRSLDLCISRLRKKLEACDPSREFIKTVRSQGYLFCKVNQ